jgi:hypothetical protein
LRKKVRKGEFTEYGFTVQYRVDASLDARAIDELLDRFLLEAVEANDLHCGGGGGPTDWEFFVCANGRRSATDGERQRVEGWLRKQAHVRTPRVGELEDAWHGREEPPALQHGSDAA